jgi:hypothetical protein
MGAKAALTAGWIAAALLVLLAGCSTTPEALETKSDAASQNYSDNYQEVYRRLAGTAGRCITGPGTPVLSMVVEATLHKELGFGEVRFVAIGLVYSNYFVLAKIEKMGPGSRVSVKANNPIISEKLSKMVFRWAGGDQEC